MAAPSLPEALEAAAARLNDAKCHHLSAVVAHAEAKRTLELSQARTLCKGVDGKNEAQRQAVLRLELDELYATLA